MVSDLRKRRAFASIRETVFFFSFTLGVVLNVTNVFASDEETPSANPDSVELVQWQAFGVAWGNYLEYPSTENAAALYPTIPHWPRDIDNNALAKQMFDSVYQNLPMLERQVYAGDRNAVRVAFRLMRISDGEFSEWLDIILGSLIRINPRLFLEELNTHRTEVRELSPLVGNLGDEFVDKIEAHNLETQLRIEALNRVDDDALNAIRDECIAELKNDVVGQP